VFQSSPHGDDQYDFGFNLARLGSERCGARLNADHRRQRHVFGRAGSALSRTAIMGTSNVRGPRYGVRGYFSLLVNSGSDHRPSISTARDHRAGIEIISAQAARAAEA